MRRSDFWRVLPERTARGPRSGQRCFYLLPHVPKPGPPPLSSRKLFERLCAMGTGGPQPSVPCGVAWLGGAHAGGVSRLPAAPEPCVSLLSLHRLAAAIAVAHQRFFAVAFRQPGGRRTWRRVNRRSWRTATRTEGTFQGRIGSSRVATVCESA